MNFKKRYVWAFLFFVPVLFVGVFFYWPLVKIFSHALDGERINDLWSFLLSKSFRQIAWFTIWQALLSTFCTMILALPSAYLVARFSFKGKKLFQALTTIPFVLPTVVAASAFMALFQRFGIDHGAFRLHHTVWALLLAHIFFNLAIVIRTVGSFWAGLNPEVEEQAKLLGATPSHIFRKITFPRLVPALAAAASVVFVFCLTSFGVVLLLSGPTRATIETEIWRQAVWRGDISVASVLAVVQLGAVMIMVLVMNFLQKRLAIGVGDGYSFQNFSAMADRVSLVPLSSLAALKNSLLFALVAAVLAALLGGMASFFIVHGTRRFSNFLDFGMMLPLGVSAVVLGFGMLISLDTPPLDLRSSWILVPIAHALLGIPFVMRTVIPTLRRIDPSLRESASLLGASPSKVTKHIDFPIAFRALGVGAAFAFAISIGEFGATSFLPRSPDRLTAPLVLFRLLGAPGEALRGQAMALAVTLMVITAATVILIEGSVFKRETIRSDF